MCVAVDKLVPRVLVAPGRAGYQRDDMRVVTRGRSRPAELCTMISTSVGGNHPFLTRRAARCI